MRARFVGLLVAVMACTASLEAQEGTLTGFRSDRELTRYLHSIHPPPPLASAIPQPLPDGTYAGPRARWPAIVAGRITNAQGRPEAAVLVQIEALGVGAVSGTDGTYRLVVPRDRFKPGEQVTLRAARTGLAPVELSIRPRPGTRLALDFRMHASVLHLEDLVVSATADAGNVTNNQHEGVDEGGIVKVHGDHLVMLRRGRLFTVDVGGGRLEPVDAVDAFGPELDPDGTWYDELLVSGDHVVVIGYSYERGGTEVGLFGIGRDGRLRYRSTHHLRSGDYYSSRNYASRLTGGKLVLYAPVAVGEAEHVARWMPAMRRWHAGAQADEFRPTLRPTRIYRAGRALDADDDLTLHTVTTCGLEDGELDCESTAVLGPPGRVFYVSPTAVYVWVTDWMGDAGRRASSMVYRLPLDGAAPTALGVEGSPVDVGSSRVDLQACKLEYSIVSPK